MMTTFRIDATAISNTADVMRIPVAHLSLVDTTRNGATKEFQFRLMALSKNDIKTIIKRFLSAGFEVLGWRELKF